MYNVALTESYFPAQGGELPPAQTIGEMMRLLKDGERLGRALASRHAEGARIAVYAHNIPEWILLELGCAFANLTLVTVNPAYQKRELKFVLEQSRSEALYYVANCAARNRATPPRFNIHPAQQVFPKARYSIITD